MQQQFQHIPNDFSYIIVKGLNSCVFVLVCVYTCVHMCCCRLVEQQGIPGGAHQSVGRPERSVLLTKYGAKGRRAAGAQSRPLLHLCTDLLQTLFHWGDRGGGKRGGGGHKGGGRSTACPVYLQEG